MNISDWVQGKAQDGELIQGFIESMDALQGIVSVYVVKSDNEEIIGKSVAVREHWIKNAADLPVNDPQLVQNLIDMALATWDEAWFQELTDTLKLIYSDPALVGSRSRKYPSHNNRLGQSA